ncbi:hypothetical protein ASZ90_010844 [hydrocarbon metagenome]|uniref:Uncharacterized protein n=1 Tax=hydrocarbon metagenome TaxID=938273 RepID=A0A0W8FFE8_9ZZZZ
MLARFRVWGEFDRFREFSHEHDVETGNGGRIRNFHPLRLWP